MKSLLLSFFLILITSIIGQSQEICDNGIDDDGDGFIDCFDPDCSSNSVCDGFYVGNDASCQATPSEFPTFSLTIDFSSVNKTANHIGRMAIGDLDRDGIPEIATQNRYTDEIYLLNGNDGSIKHVQSIDNPRWRIAMANAGDDNCGEVYAISYKSSDYRIVAFDCELNEIWQSEIRDNDPLTMGFADFDQDGAAEMYYKDEIRDPLTGTRLVNGNDNNWGSINGGPVAVNILGDSKLELVSGGTIYSVNLGARTADSGSLTAIATIPGGYKVKSKNSMTSVADYNLDGFLDVIITGEDSNDTTTVFFWDVQNNVVKTYSESISVAEAGSSSYLKGWPSGTGRLNIGDLDGDGLMNVSYVSGKYLYALDENWEKLWRVVINEETSGYTGCTLFDFNGDGKTEVVYRDEQWLYIINGTDGTVFTQMQCISRTNIEYPIVADVDADGATELCIVCGTDDAAAWANFNDLSYSENSQVRVFKSGGEPWVPARRLWNQHGYMNVNINDDLSIPQFQQDHHLVYSSGVCTTGPNRPLNGFLNQSPFLDSQGCPTYASPDLAYVSNSMTITQPDCPDLDFTVTFQIENLGDVSLSGDVPVSFYNGDPTFAGATLLGTELITLNSFGTSDIFDVGNITVTGPGSAFTLYVVLNDAGTTVPTPIALPNSDFLECDYANNIVSASVNPNAFSLSTEKTDNLACSGSSAPANGSARAFRLISGVEETADYTFNWFNSATASGAPDFTGAIYSGLSAGTYSVYAVHNAAMCSSDTVQVTIADVAISVNAVVSQVQPNTHCTIPTGELSVAVNGGEPVGNFDYEWYDGNSVGGGLLISTAQNASNLTSGTYTVLVTEKATGCQTIESFPVDDNTNVPVVSAATVDIVCSNANSGSVSVNIGGSTAGFTFEWFNGPSIKPVADFTGSSVTNLPQGDYTVVATDNASNCKSTAVTVTIVQTSPPVITGTSSTNYQSCDSSLPDGTVAVTFTGNATDFTIEWFAGSNTTAPSISTGSTVSGLTAGVYTVQLTEISTGCSVSDEATIINNVVVPTISAAVTDVSMCSPFNGSIEISVSLESVSDYTFSWYDGNTVKASPDYSETGNILNTLAPGEYTVSAFHNTRNCLASAITVEVMDIAPAIQITQNSAITSFPSACAVADGALVVDIALASGPNTSGFDVDWYQGADTSGSIFFSESGVSSSTASNLISDFYTVVALNLDNGCEDMETFFLPFVDAHSLQIVGVPSPATTCIPNNDGSVTLDLTPTTLGGFDESDYELNIYIGTDTSVPPVQTITGVAGTSNYTFSGLSTSTYTVQAIEIDPLLNGCSVNVLVEIGLDSTDPVIAPTVTLNSFCAVANGTIALDIDTSADPNDYTISWFEGLDTSADPLGTATSGSTGGVNGELALNLTSGIYTASVLNNATQCSTTFTGTIADNQPTISMIVNFEDLLICGSSVNGSAEVTSVLSNNVAEVLTDYDYEWKDSGMTTIGSNSTTISGLSAGVYYITVTNTSSLCDITTQFTIENDTSGDPIVSLAAFQNPTRCAEPTNLTGELEVSITGLSTTGYSYEWYAGTSATGTILSTASSLLGQPAGSYTVQVTENDPTSCAVTKTYELIIETIPITISASATPLTSCAADDGTVFATITSGGSTNYSYDWINSAAVSAGNGKNLTGLSVDTYTVIATDINDNTCFTSPITVSVTNAQIFPNLQVAEISPLTVCDLNNANGSARGTVDNGFVGYTFEWFRGSTVSGTPIYTGSEYSQMDTTTIYTVQATDNISLCTTTEQISISADIPKVSDPLIDVLSNVTSCITDNGQLAASVDGVTSEYILDWYIGDQVSGTPDFTGEIYSDIPIGFYTVKATSLITSCESGAVTAEIVEDKKYPEIEIETGSAACELSNGFAVLTITNGLEAASIVWSGGDLTAEVTGPNLLDAPAGFYSVEVVTVLGCGVIEDAEIKTEVNPFNGISRNGDSKNDFFKIDCITNYPNNTVKIFNRSGTLVYEADGYDNLAVYFEGVSNKGMNILGNSLPDGTYFYIIDKKDGLKPLNGYLEIVK